MRCIDVTGQRFGRLVVTSTEGIACTATCDCGTVITTAKYSLRKGLTKSCGCLRKDCCVRLVHGESRPGKWSPEYRAWVNMNTRCHNPNSTRFSDWGGRGIKVCDQWRHDFATFLKDVGRKPGSTYSLDRIDCNGNYEPGNVRWATRTEQALNCRRNRIVSAFGKQQTVFEWAKESGIVYGALLWRLDHGWDPERSLTTPSRGKRSKVCNS